LAKSVAIAGPPTNLEAQVAAVAPARLLQPIDERHQAGLSFPIIRGQVHQHADAPHPLGLLRARRERQ
jgi:hypothetical protein